MDKGKKMGRKEPQPPPGKPVPYSDYGRKEIIREGITPKAMNIVKPPPPPPPPPKR